MHIVTGGAGFIGSACVWKLNQMGITDIIVVDNLSTTEKWKNLVNLRYEDYIHKKDFIDLISEGNDPFGTEAVIHMGACSSTTERNADYLMENNYRYTQAVCNFCVNNSVRLVTASSAATYGDGEAGFSDDESRLRTLRPLNMYGYSKHLFDLWAQDHGMLDSLASLKFFNVFGPNEYHKGDMMSVVCKAFSQIGETGSLKLFKSYRPEFGDGEQRRDFIYVKDCVDVIWWFLEHPDKGGVYNVGTGRARSWNDLARAVFAAMGREPRIEYIEMPETLRGKYQYFTQAPMDKLRDAGCDHQFTSLEEAVLDYVTGYLAQADPFL